MENMSSIKLYLSDSSAYIDKSILGDIMLLDILQNEYNICYLNLKNFDYKRLNSNNNIADSYNILKYLCSRSIIKQFEIELEQRFNKYGKITNQNKLRNIFTLTLFNENKWKWL